VRPIVHCLLVTLIVGAALPIAAQSQSLRIRDQAPDFKLRIKDGQREVQLSSFKGKQPVVLVFGSFT
jgi:peroxiredoxin